MSANRTDRLKSVMPRRAMRAIAASGMIAWACLLRRRSGRMFALVVAAGALTVIALPTAQTQAAPASAWGFALLSNPNPPLPFALPPATAASSSGMGANLTAHPAPGSYQITLPGVGTPGGNLGVVHVTAASAERAVWCQASQWYPAAGNEVIDILCYRAPGAVPVNTDFSVTFSLNSPPTPPGSEYGYLESSGGNGTITQFNSAGAAITSTLLGPGRWQVTMPGLGGTTPQAGGIQVTPATARPEHCKVWTWRTYPSRQDIYVACFTPAGAPADLRWTLSYQNKLDITGRVPADFGYIWNTAAPPAATHLNSSGAVNQVTHIPAGYTVIFPRIYAPMNDVQLSASGANHDFCSLTTPPWRRAGPAVIVPRVSCFHLNGLPSAADDFFATYTSR